MGATTPIYALPYPATGDPANVPADMAALANAIEAKIAPGTVSGQIPIWDNAAKKWAPGNDAGAELAYTQLTASFTVNATTEAGADTVITCPAVTFNGTDRIIAEFYTPHASTGASPAALLVTHLFDGATSLGNFSVVQSPASAVFAVPILVRRLLTPSAGAHTFSLRARVTGSSGVIQGGTGAAGGYAPGYLRITRA